MQYWERVLSEKCAAIERKQTMRKRLLQLVAACALAFAAAAALGLLSGCFRHRVDGQRPAKWFMEKCMSGSNGWDTASECASTAGQFGFCEAAK